MAKILIIKHGSLGDVILSLYAIYSINKHFKKSTITILTEEKYASIFLKLSFIKSIKIDNRPKFYHLIKYIKFFKWFYKSDFEWVIDLQTSKRTNFYFLIFSFLKDFNWNGIAKNCSHPHLDKNRKKLHTIDRQEEQLKYAGIYIKCEPDWNYLKYKVNKFDIDKPYAILVPGGSKHRKNKRWAFNNFLEIIKYLKSKNILSVLIGGSDEKDIYKIYKKNKFVLNLIGNTNFSDLAFLSSSADLIIGNDTGPMHLLVACSKNKTTKIILFGDASNPNLCAPKGENVKIVQNKNINKIKPESIIDIINKKKYSKL